MTKQEAIDFINNLSDDNVGVMVVTINKDDVEQYLSGEFNREYKGLSNEDKDLFLSSVSSQMHQLLEEGDNWGVGNLMKEAVEGQSVQDVLDYFDENCIVY